MGEDFYRKAVLGMLFFLSLFFFVGVLDNIAKDYGMTGFVVHSKYSSFSAPEQGFIFNYRSNSVSVSDDAVYGIGYYSINGSPWQNFSFSGSQYGESDNWKRGVASFSPIFFGMGEHYVIVYSCTYNSAISSWDCHDNNWQLIEINNSIHSNNTVSCADTCGSGEYCFNDVCLLNVSGNIYFVGTNGDDNYSGNFTHPWKTWSKAFHTAQGGDIVYFRGGVYPIEVKDGSGIRYIPEEGLGYDGTAENPIRYYNYPGEMPTLDCKDSFASNVDGSWDVFNYGLYIKGADYVHMKGLNIRNVNQRNYSNENGIYDICYGIYNEFSNHILFENIDIGYCGGIGIETRNAIYAEIINSDFHDLCDNYHHVLPGSYGSGTHGAWDAGYTGYKYFYGCRAWNCSDQGFSDSGPSSLIVHENCWSFNNGNSNILGAAGSGYKIGDIDFEEFLSVENPSSVFKNCISANNEAVGFKGNEGSIYYPAKYWIYNCLSYKEGMHSFEIRNTNASDEDEYQRILKNNIAYNFGSSGYGFAAYTNIGSVYTHINNTWDVQVEITDDDFESLDISQLILPRKSDGSLPDITFGHLALGSDLIDAGVVIEGYHCSTGGVHPGEDCVEWYGSAPDLGPFESNY